MILVERIRHERGLAREIPGRKCRESPTAFLGGVPLSTFRSHSRCYSLRSSNGTMAPNAGATRTDKGLPRHKKAPPTVYALGVTKFVASAKASGWAAWCRGMDAARLAFSRTNMGGAGWRSNARCAPLLMPKPALGRCFRREFRVCGGVIGQEVNAPRVPGCRHHVPAPPR